ncbi:BsuBI/PstI family type II restriction endonuclease [Pediococcus pentosaceus]
MSKIEDAVQILKDVEFSTNISTKSMAARFILAATRMQPDGDWQPASNEWIRIHDALVFLNKYYGFSFKENTRESLRKSGPKLMESVGLAEYKNMLATNSGKFSWRLSSDFFEVIKSFGTDQYENRIKVFKNEHGTRVQLIRDARQKTMLNIKFDDHRFQLTPGKHNELHKAILEKFAPIFAPNAELLYVGDTAKKDLLFQHDKITELGFPMNMHDVIPDIILYDSQREWMFLIEAVSTVGPMSFERVKRIKDEYTGKAGLVFVTAFRDWKTYRKFVGKIAWETEIWISDFPDHMIHMNGDRFMGPY